MTRNVVVLDRDVAEAISDMLHKAELGGVDFTETEDEMWGYLSDAICAAVELRPETERGETAKEFDTWWNGWMATRQALGTPSALNAARAGWHASLRADGGRAASKERGGK